MRGGIYFYYRFLPSLFAPVEMTVDCTSKHFYEQSFVNGDSILMTKTSANSLSVSLSRLIMPRLMLSQYKKNRVYRKKIRNSIKQQRTVGFCVFSGSTDDARTIIAELRALTKSKLLFSCDCEWGLTMRLSGDATEFPHALALAHSAYPDAVYKAALSIGREMKAVGLDWNFAPVADVNSDRNNPIINIRAFGEIPEIVSHFSVIYAEGLRDAGIIATAKHFPGHGQTKTDSHLALPVLKISTKHFEKIELPPFKHLIANQIETIMTGHLAVPTVAKVLGANDSEQILPATLSPFLTQKLLRNQLGFDGVVVVDSMEMAGVKKLYPNDADAAELAIKAGNDIILMSHDFELVYSTLLERAENDAVLAERIFESAIRVETLIATDRSKTKSHTSDTKELAQAIAKGAIETTVENPSFDTIRQYTIICDDNELQATRFALLQQLLQQWEYVAPEKLHSGGAVFILERPRGKLLDQQGSETSVSNVSEFIARLVQTAINPECIFLLGNPYRETEVELLESGSIVKTFSDSEPSIRALAEWIGEQYSN